MFTLKKSIKTLVSLLFVFILLFCLFVPVAADEYTEDEYIEISEDGSGNKYPDGEQDGFAFHDLRPGDWFYDSVKRAYAYGLMKGTSEFSFSPNFFLERNQAAVILWRMAGEPQYAFENFFPDVNNPYMYYISAIMWAKNCGVFNGYKNGLFGLSDFITREQTATILYNFAKYHLNADVSETASLDGFLDADEVSSWAKTPMEWCVAVGILSGTKEGYLMPRNNTLRGEAAKMFSNFYEMYFVD